VARMKFLTIFVILMLALAACGGDEPAATEAPEAPAEEAEAPAEEAEAPAEEAEAPAEEAEEAEEAVDSL